MLTSLERVAHLPTRSTVSMNERLLGAAARMTIEHGWAHVTMAKLADEVGVSRQTVYNEMGSKAGLAEAMILAELARFLDVVDAAFADHPRDLVAAIEAAARRALEYGRDNALLHAIVSATHGADTELLPLLTTHSASLLGVAKGVLAERVATYDVRLSAERLDDAIDLIVRVVLSHVMQPSGTPQETAESLAWIADAVLG